MRVLATFDGVIVCFEVFDVLAVDSDLILLKNDLDQTSLIFRNLFNPSSYVLQLFESGKVDLSGHLMGYFNDQG